jgi:signal transduction histidine kinase
MGEITVRDYGLGIPPDQIPLLFNRFARLPRELASSVGGSGLGLYLCRVFAEGMGGTIGVESTGVPGEGATFRLRLPLPPEPSAASATSDASGGTLLSAGATLHDYVHD